MLSGTTSLSVLYCTEATLQFTFASKNTVSTISHYEDAYGNVTAGRKDEDRSREAQRLPPVGSDVNGDQDLNKEGSSGGMTDDGNSPRGAAETSQMSTVDAAQLAGEYERGERALTATKPGYVPPCERFIGPVQHMSWFNVQKW